MAEANVYELSKTIWSKAFPKLIETAYAKGGKVLIFCDSEENVENIDKLLWEYEQLSFLPHVTYKDKHVNETPIIISNDFNASIETKVLVLADFKLPEKFDTSSKILVMYDRNVINHKDLVDSICIKFNESNIKINKFIQNPNGIWERSENRL